MAVAVARGGSDTNRHLNLEDQLDNAHYFCPNVVWEEFVKGFSTNLKRIVRLSLSW